VDKCDLDVSDSHNVTWLVGNKLIGGDFCGSFHPRHFGSLHVNRAVDSLQQCGDALDVVTHD
jgi:hypothetical protein